jgi:DtxR family Mn-dependent transcriptional regulator
MGMSSVSIQDYLQTIYRLQTKQSPVSTNALAAQLEVTPASVSGMMRKLHGEGLVQHVLYRGVALTDKGEREALLVLRRHRLWERFLTDVLGLDWDEVHSEAHQLEHATSERLAERLAEFLNNPATDPHGQQIPASDGTLRARPRVSLADVDHGQVVQVLEVPDDDPERLRFFAQVGLLPGSEVIVLATADHDDQISILVGDAEHTMGRERVGSVLVSESNNVEE